MRKFFLRYANEIGCPIRRSIVHHENVERRVQLKNSLDKCLNVLPLVVSGDDNESVLIRHETHSTIHFVSKSKRIIQCGALVVLSIASFKIFWLLWLRLLFEAQNPLYGDAGTYFAMGRGILNGLTPYEDLFEVKPPGMFLLTAFSLWLTGNETPAIVLNLLMTGSIPLLLIFFAHRILKKESLFMRTCGSLSAILFGSALAIHTIDGAGGIQTEAYGSFFGILYVLAITWEMPRISRTSMAIASLMLLFAIGIKEPFLLVLFASCILLSRSWQFFLRSFVIPLVIATTIGMIVMLFLGYLGPYFTVYLPEIFSGRVLMDKMAFWDPLWIHTFNLRAIILNIIVYAPLPLLGFVIGALWINIPVIHTGISQKQWIIISWGTVLSGLLFFGYLYFLKMLALDMRYPLGRLSVFFLLPAVTAFLCVAGALTLRKGKQWALLCYSGISIAAVFPIVIAIAVGDYMTHHYITAIPAYFAVYVLSLHFLPAARNAHSTRLLYVVVTILLSFMPFTAPTVDWDKKHAWQWELHTETEKGKRFAMEIDTMMDRCGFSRYLWWAGAPVAFTRHSPYMMGWSTKRAFAAENPNVHFQEKFRQSLADARFVVMQRNSVEEMENAEVQKVFRLLFTDSPPPCAEGLAVPEGYTFLYRKPE
jgi:hypothetical protein